MTFTLLSSRNRPVTFECDTIRELTVGEHIHFTSEEQSIMCHVCGKIPTVWTDDAELWQRSAMRCL